MKNTKVNSCMMGESIFKIGDCTALAQGWGLYRDKMTLEECTSLRIMELYYTDGEESCLPKFRAVVKTNKDRLVDMGLEDLKEVRNCAENREELNKVGYDFDTGSIYCKGYEIDDGIWKFFNIGLEGNINYTHSY
ncbi:hypothetical protein [uncultured Clostridium sp.]|uniref:hypothetical protein n=1 Tax=uncultured Clostridium sp. TaxID=59620 RepID=UPI0028EB5FED|nr:hypothetical protein [uncultured Clostridium sp.]